MEKNRLYEIFNKVNKTVINEATANDDRYYQIKSDLVKTFENSRFNNGIPTKIETKIQGTEAELLLDRDSIEIDNSNKNIINYTVFYNVEFNENNINIVLPVEIVVETIKTETIVGFKNIIHPIAQEIELNIQ